MAYVSLYHNFNRSPEAREQAIQRAQAWDEKLKTEADRRKFLELEEAFFLAEGSGGYIEPGHVGQEEFVRGKEGRGRGEGCEGLGWGVGVGIGSAVSGSSKEGGLEPMPLAAFRGQVAGDVPPLDLVFGMTSMVGRKLEDASGLG
jgi:hypothetical protein